MTLKPKNTEVEIDKIMQPKKKLNDKSIEYIKNMIKKKIKGDKPYKKPEQSENF